MSTPGTGPEAGPETGPEVDPERAGKSPAAPRPDEDEPQAPLQSSSGTVTPTGEHSFWTGRSGLIVPAIILGVGLFLVYGITQMEIAGDGELFGPQAFPWIAAVACFIVAALLTVQILRTPELPESMLTEDGSVREGTHSNWPATLGAVGTFIGFALILETVGWIIAAALVFWGLTVSMGNRRYLFNLLVGLAMSSILQLVFSGLLGLNLPSGVMGG